MRYSIFRAGTFCRVVLFPCFVPVLIYKVSCQWFLFALQYIRVRDLEMAIGDQLIRSMGKDPEGNSGNARFLLWCQIFSSAAD
jgi:hypothetical protein